MNHFKIRTTSQLYMGIILAVHIYTPSLCMPVKSHAIQKNTDRNTSGVVFADKNSMP